MVWLVLMTGCTQKNHYKTFNATQLIAIFARDTNTDAENGTIGAFLDINTKSDGDYNFFATPPYPPFTMELVTTNNSDSVYIYSQVLNRTFTIHSYVTTELQEMRNREIALTGTIFFKGSYRIWSPDGKVNYVYFRHPGMNEINNYKARHQQ